MKNLKKSLSTLLALLFIAVMFVGIKPVQASAATKGAAVSYAAYDHSPLLAGEQEGFFVQAKGFYSEVQYSVWVKDNATGKWTNVLPYGTSYDSEEIVKLMPDKVYAPGKYTASIWVKETGKDGMVKNVSGSFDGYYVIPFACAAQDATKWVKGSGNVEFKETELVAGKAVTLKDIAGISGMSGSYLYKFHVRDFQGNWTIDKNAYSANPTWTPEDPGTYLVDIWAADSKAPTVREVIKLQLVEVKAAVTDPKAAAIKAAIDAIAALPAADKLALTDEAAVTSARTLVTAAKAAGAVDADITNLAALVAAEAKIAELKAAAGADVLQTSAATATFGGSFTATLKVNGTADYAAAVKYVVYDGTKAISAVAGTALGTSTTVFPAKKTGDKVTVKLLDAAGTVVLSQDVIIGTDAVLPVVKPAETSIKVTASAATFGSNAKVEATGYPTAVKFVIYDGTKAISAVAGAALGTNTTVFPAKKTGDKVTVKLLDATGAVVATQEVTIGESTTVPVVTPTEVTITATVAAATFGSSVKVEATGNPAAVKYVIYVGTKPVSALAGTVLGASTTVFPAKVAGDTVTVKLLDATGKEVATKDVVLK